MLCYLLIDGYSLFSLILASLFVNCQLMVELEYIDKISHVTVGKVLKKNELKPWKVKGWVIPRANGGEFVAHMENVLDVYKRPYTPSNPVSLHG